MTEKRLLEILQFMTIYHINNINLNN